MTITDQRRTSIDPPRIRREDSASAENPMGQKEKNHLSVDSALSKLALPGQPSNNARSLSAIVLPGAVRAPIEGRTENCAGLEIACYDNLTVKRILDMGVILSQDQEGRGLIGFDQSKIYGPAAELSFDSDKERLEIYRKNGGVAIYVVAQNDQRLRSDGTIDAASALARIIVLTPDRYLGSLHVPGCCSLHQDRIRVRPELEFEPNRDLAHINFYRTLAELRKRGVNIDAQRGIVRVLDAKKVFLQTRDDWSKRAALDLTEIPLQEKTSKIMLRVNPPNGEAGEVPINQCDIIVDMINSEPTARACIVTQDGRILIQKERSVGEGGRR
jgi:hypothetical protein